MPRTVKNRRPDLAKGGVCGYYRSAKTVYRKLAVAEFDRAVMQAKYPAFVFEVFRCRHCGRWHVGRRTGGDYVVEDRS